MSSNFTKIAKGVTLESLAADPIDGQNGDIYYNNVLLKFRKYQSGVWEDLDNTGSPTALTRIDFLQNGTWDVPLGVTQAFVVGVGGGGGGAGGASGVGSTGDIVGGGGGAGGHGAVPMELIANVTGGTTLTVALGAGGAGGTSGGSGSGGTAGIAGGNTTITGPGVNLFFPGAPGGVIAAARAGAAVNGPAATNLTIAPYTVSSNPGGDGSAGILNGAAANGGAGEVNMYIRDLSLGGGGSTGISDEQGGGGGGGAGGNGLGVGGAGGHGAKATNFNYAINSVTRTNNIVTINLSEAAYATHQANIGEFIVPASIDATINGVHTIIAKPAASQLQFIAVGPDLYTNAKFVGQVAGMLTNVTITANSTGTTGNSIILPFTGANTINQAITTWNAGHPTNLATLTTGDGTQIPNNGTNITLAGGTDQAGSLTFSRLNNRARFNNFVAGMKTYVHLEAELVGVTGNAISLSFNGSTSINTAITAWNTANPGNKLFLLYGDGTQIPDISTTITLTGGAAAATANSGGNGQPGNGPGSGGGGGGGGGCGSGSNFTSGAFGGAGRAGAVYIIY